jgi:hypothetical protein
MSILLLIAAWLGLSGAFVAGWAAFHRRVGPTPSVRAAIRDRLVA